MKETEMYPPMKKYLEREGYTVHSEVEGIDILAQKGEEMIAIEMKTSFNLKLVYQLIERRKIVDKVYAYVPLGKGGRWPKEYKRMCGLVKRLECGLITLTIRGRSKSVTVEFDPKPFVHRKNYVKKKIALKEFHSRSVDLNKAGSRSEIIFTAYKEKAIRIALYLYENGKATPKDIASTLSIDNAARILQSNYHFWFDRVERGIYQITPEFEKFLMENRKKIGKYAFSPDL